MAGGKVLEDGLHALSERLERSVVHDRGLTPRTLLGQGHLGPFAAFEFGGGPAAALDVLDASLEGGVDEDDGVALLVALCLEEQGCIDDDAPHALRAGAVDDLAPEGLDDGVEHGLEAGALRGVVEDDGGDCLAVDLAVGVQDGGPPPPHELPLNVGAIDGGAGVAVGVDDEAAELAEDGGDGGLARTDAADQAEHDGRGGRLAGGIVEKAGHGTLLIEGLADGGGQRVGVGDAHPRDIDAVRPCAADEQGAQAQGSLPRRAVDDDLLDVADGQRA